MAVLIRTREVPAARRHDAWRSIVCDTLGPLDLRIDRDAPLHGRIDAGALGPLGVGRVRTSTPHSVHRTRGLIRRDSPELYRVVLAMSGSLLVAQDGRSARLRQGQFVIYDFGRPYELCYNAPVHLAVFSVPRASLAVPAGTVARLTAVPVTSDEGTGALTAPVLRRVTADLDGYRPASAARLSTVVTDLITTTIAERAERLDLVPEDSRERTLLLRIHSFIEQHLGDPALTPSTLAAAHHVSLRQLHRLFEPENTTAAAWIRHRRLERCRRELGDPVAGTTPVGAVGARWGFPDPAHFSRVFRRTYGVSPLEYRRAALG
ncbi:helix-turn-helix domain-containing protein [Prauserella shujinwangii]|nr:helix-turn-helix domain-containing protein [Prauserella shujinwangii]